MIIGGGSCAQGIALDLLEKGIEVSVVSRDGDTGFSLPDFAEDTPVEVLTRTRLLACRGAVGNFTVSMDREGKVIERIVSNIVIAEQYSRAPNFGLYGLTSSDHVISLSQFNNFINEPQQHNDLVNKGNDIVFLAGLLREGDPVIAKEIMSLSFDLQSRFKKQVYILTGNLKAAGDGLEALYRKTRDVGVVYAKFSDSLPSISQGEDKRAGIEFYDEITGKQFRLVPDIAVVDELIVPSKYLPELAKVLKLDRDFAGFIQSDNVRRIPVYTNRKGIMAAGPSRIVQAHYDHDIDAANAGLSIFGLVKGNAPAPENRAEIDRGRCVRCLTCYRLCPFMAIRLDAKPVVVPEACEGCGICTAECPMTTISIKGLSGPEISGKIVRPDGVDGEKAFIPFIVAFCCSRSASMAKEEALSNNLNIPEGLVIIDVPCAGGISLDHILLALKKGADGIMIITCHEGNCHSEKGNVYARRRAERALELFNQMGLERQRLVIKTIAANMAREFSELTMEFEKQIIGLGVSRIKDGGNDKTG
jgi:heterodisulfide reductase subunit A-like polyferredoxin/coenzyme F420-reducing hydrogenase delta subunit